MGAIVLLIFGIGVALIVEGLAERARSGAMKWVLRIVAVLIVLAAVRTAFVPG